MIGVVIVVISSIQLINYYLSANKTEKEFDLIKDLIQEIEITSNDRDNIDVENNESTSTEQLNKHDGNQLDVRQKLNYEALYELNKDFLGWIKIDDTVIDYPVMLTPKDEEFYLHRNFNGYYDFNGTPFCEAEIDPIKPSDNITIYGHHIKSGIMFNQLDKFKSIDFYRTHKQFMFDTIYRWGTYEVIAVFLTNVNPGCFEYWNVKDCNEHEFNTYIQYCKENALYKTDIIDTVKYGDKLLSLSTCANHEENGRLVVVAKQISSEETEFYKSLN